MKTQILIVFIICTTIANGQLRKFPEAFKFGVATASYQVEGAWNVDGKGENIWDHLVHSNSSVISDLSSGDDACNSYYLYKEDVRMIKSLGVDFYRFSISWSRILPTGFANEINEAGIRYYNNLINELLANGIQPIITLYHWDLPQPLQVLGGWTSTFMVDYFVDYARVIFDHFADRVNTWITFNEPLLICGSGYGDPGLAPRVNMSGVADYLCSKTVLMAHAKTYRLFYAEYAQKFPGRVGFAEALQWYIPATDSEADIEATERYISFKLAWFVDPIYNGDYPERMRNAVDETSKQQILPRSRLPEFTEEEKKILTGSADFFGVNHYFTNRIAQDYNDTKNSPTSLKNDLKAVSVQMLSPYPIGFRALLNWIKDKYDNPETIIFENGLSTIPSASRDDDGRVAYYRAYMEAVLDAILEDGCNITAYTAWSLMDNFEWNQGYTSRFGIFEVDFQSPEKTRRERKSAKVYREIVRTKVIDYDYNPSAYE